MGMAHGASRDRSPTAPDAAHASSSSRCLMPGRQPAIAIVDDDESLRDAIGRLLNSCGYATQVFASAESFLNSRTANEVACLVLDIHLTGMSGLELRQRLKAEGSELPVVFITAADDAYTLQQVEEVGCAACLRKPFTAGSLIHTVGKVVGR